MTTALWATACIGDMTTVLLATACTGDMTTALLATACIGDMTTVLLATSSAVAVSNDNTIYAHDPSVVETRQMKPTTPEESSRSLFSEKI